MAVDERQLLARKMRAGFIPEHDIFMGFTKHESPDGGWMMVIVRKPDSTLKGAMIDAFKCKVTDIEAGRFAFVGTPMDNELKLELQRKNESRAKLMMPPQSELAFLMDKPGAMVVHTSQGDRWYRMTMANLSEVEKLFNRIKEGTFPVHGYHDFMDDPEPHSVSLDSETPGSVA